MNWKEAREHRLLDQEYERLTDRDEFNHVKGQIQKQQENRRLWNEGDDAESLSKMILEEGQELKKAITESELTGDVFPVASEIADVLYLTIRLCQELGFDPLDLLKMKTLRNSLKYADEICNNGFTKPEATKLAKSGWEAMGGDHAFAHAYLEVYAQA